jgi:N-alpha-acetyltransferase 50
MFDCSHVQVSNKDAISFYEKFGFNIVERKENYYKRIEPADAFVVQKNLKENQVITSSQSSQLDDATTETSTMNSVD